MDDLSKSKAYKLIQTFSASERNAFDLFLHSPYFNTDERLPLCFQLFLQHAEESPDQELSGELIYRTIFPEETIFQAYRITRLTSALVTMFDTFIQHQALREKSILNQLGHIQALGERGLQVEFNRAIEKLSEELQSNQDSHHHYYAFRLSEYLLLNAAHATRLRKQDEVKYAFDLIDSFQTVQKLRLLGTAINQSLITKGQIPEWVFEALAKLETSSNSSEPLIRLYDRSLRLLLDKSDDNWMALVNAIQENARILENDVLQEFYQQALNFQIRAYNQDQSDLNRCRLLCNFYMEMVNGSIILNEGKISAWNYKNIASLHARIGDLDQMQTFINSFEGKISGQDANASRAFVAGLFAFYQGRYEDAEGNRGANSWMYQVLNSGAENLFWELEARAYRLLIKFEQGDYEDEMPNQESLRMFIDRNKKLNKISKEHHLAYANLLKSLNKLHLAQHLSAEKQLPKFQKLQSEFKEKQYLAQKQWFIQKMKQILNDIEPT